MGMGVGAPLLLDVVHASHVVLYVDSLAPNESEGDVDG